MSPPGSHHLQSFVSFGWTAFITCQRLAPLQGSGGGNSRNRFSTPVLFKVRKISAGNLCICSGFYGSGAACCQRPPRLRQRCSGVGTRCYFASGANSGREVYSSRTILEMTWWLFLLHWLRWSWGWTPQICSRIKKNRHLLCYCNPFQLICQDELDKSTESKKNIYICAT